MWNTGRLKTFLIIGILLSSGIAIAEDPPQGAVNLRIDFKNSKGFANYTYSDGLENDEAQVMENTNISNKFNLEPRFGTALVASNPGGLIPGRTGNFIKILNSTTTAVLGKIFIVLRYNDRIQALNMPPATFYQAYQDLVGQTDPIIIGNRMYVVQESSRSIIIVNDYNNQNITVEGSTKVPSGKYAQAHLNRFIVSGNTITANRVFYSLDQNPENFHPLDFFDLNLKSNDREITGIGEPFLGMLPIYTQSSTRVMIGNLFPSAGSGGNLTERIIADNIGAIHHRTIKNKQDGQYFFSMGVNGSAPGIYRFNGVSVQEMTRKIRNYFTTIVSLSTAVIPSAFVYENRYCLCTTSKNGVNIDRMVCLDEQNKPEIYTGIGITADYWDVFNSTAYGIHSGPGNEMFVKSLSRNTNTEYYELSNNNPLTLTWQSKDFDFGPQNRARVKNIDRAYIDFEKTAGNFKISAIYDFGKATTTWTVDMQTDYGNGSSTSAIKTVVRSSGTVVDRLMFPQPSPSSPNTNSFGFVNFLISSTGPVHINSIDIWATFKPLP